MEQQQSAWRSPWVIGWILLIVAVLAANGVMIFLASGNNPGLVVEDYYERGQGYEENMLKRMAEDPGWEMALTPPVAIRLNEPATFEFSVRTAEGVGVDSERVTLHVYRPSNAREDFSLPMRMEAPGLYRVDASFPLKGVWDLLATVDEGGREHHAALRIQVAGD